jgi:hypothetical protein
MNSRTRTSTGDLARTPAKRSRDFLLQAANLSDDLAAIGRFTNRFGQLVPEHLKTFGAPSDEPGALNLIDPDLVPLWQIELRDALREIWRGPDLRTKEWGVFRLIDGTIFEHSNPRRSDYRLGLFHTIAGTIPALPPPTPFEQIANHLRCELHLVKICPNAECPAPYFFAVRRSQVYCSAVCVMPFQCEAKRKWWAKHGAAWRKKRKGR